MTTLTEALAPASDQLTADDLISGPRNLTFTAVKIGKDGRSTRVSLNYQGDNGRPFKPCKTMGRAMVMVWSIVEGREDDFIGKSVTVYRDPEVAFGDQGKIGGVRISHMSHITKSATVKLTVSQGIKRAFVFQPLAARNDASVVDKAAIWATETIAAINAADSIATLADVDVRSVKAMLKLESDRPKLYADVKRAMSAREHTLGSAINEIADEDPFGLLPITQDVEPS